MPVQLGDETHDTMMNIYLNRFGEQVETVTTGTLFKSSPGSARRARPSGYLSARRALWAFANYRSFINPGLSDAARGRSLLMELRGTAKRLKAGQK